MDCKEARLLLNFVLVPDELSGDDRRALEEHFHECPVCRSLAEQEEHVDRAIRKVMVDVPVPPDLKQRVMGAVKLRQKALARRRWMRAGAVAAVLTLFLVGGYFYLQMQRPALDIDQLRSEVNFKYKAQREQVNAWLQQHCGSEFFAPADFDYGLLASWHLVDMHGTQVPMLLFVNEAGGGNFAQVYILSDRHFDLEAIRREKVYTSSGVSLNVRYESDPSNPHLLYLIIYRSQLDAFRTSNPAF